MHEGNVPRRERKIKDIPFLVLFAVVLSGLCYLGYDTIKRGNPFRSHIAYDSWGNICGAKNDPIPQADFSGMDQTSRKFAFYFGLIHPEKVIAICVSECPTDTTTCRELVQKNGYKNFTDFYINAVICAANDNGWPDSCYNKTRRLNDPHDNYQKPPSYRHYPLRPPLIVPMSEYVTMFNTCVPREVIERVLSQYCIRI